jgi:beta-lactamase regulating signal transducer with metallopeptidase domain
MNAALVLTALFNGAWQGAVLCGAAYIVLRRMRALNATTMFTVWSVLLAICVILPFANYAFAARPYTVRLTPVTQTYSVAPRVSHHRLVPARIVETVTGPAPAPTLRDRALSLSGDLMHRAWIVLLLLGAIALLRLAVLARDVICMFAARRAACRIDAPLSTPLSIRRAFEFATSGDLKSPCVLGFMPALIVLPQEVLTASRDELLSVVLHEAEHVRRYDDVQNLLHRVISALGFFCPGITIALRELALCRERICDDAAIARMGDPVMYATTLTDFAQWALGKGVPVPSFVFKRKQLIQRLEMLLDRAVNHSLRTNRRFAVSAALAFVIASAIVLRIQVPVIAQEFAPPAPVHAHLHVHHQAAISPKPVVPPRRIAAVHVALAPHPAPSTRPKAAKPKVHFTRVRTFASIAPRTTVAIAAPTVAIAPIAVAPVTQIRSNSSDALLNALESSGLTRLSVDDLIALRDHGVSAALVSSAHAFFGGNLTAKDLVRLADSGIDPAYLQALRSTGWSSLCADDVVRLRDHGVTASYIARIHAYNPRATLNDIIRLHDSGF